MLDIGATKGEKHPQENPSFLYLLTSRPERPVDQGGSTESALFSLSRSHLDLVLTCGHERVAFRSLAGHACPRFVLCLSFSPFSVRTCLFLILARGTFFFFFLPLPRWPLSLSVPLHRRSPFTFHSGFLLITRSHYTRGPQCWVPIATRSLDVRADHGAPFLIYEISFPLIRLHSRIRWLTIEFPLWSSFATVNSEPDGTRVQFHDRLTNTRIFRDVRVDTLRSLCWRIVHPLRVTRDFNTLRTGYFLTSLCFRHEYMAEFYVMTMFQLLKSLQIIPLVNWCYY